jgi:hypothetical protein
MDIFAHIKSVIGIILGLSIAKLLQGQDQVKETQAMQTSVSGPCGSTKELDIT